MLADRKQQGLGSGKGVTILLEQQQLLPGPSLVHEAKQHCSHNGDSKNSHSHPDFRLYRVLTLQPPLPWLQRERGSHMSPGKTEGPLPLQGLQLDLLFALQRSSVSRL